MKEQNNLHNEPPPQAAENSEQTSVNKIDELDNIVEVEDAEEDFLRESPDETQDRFCQKIFSQLNNLTETVASLTAKFGTFEQVIYQIESDRKAMDILSQQNKQLNEELYERELVKPVFLTLIGLADRHEDQISRCGQHLNKIQEQKRPTAEKALRFLINSIQADLTEIHDVLARFGVERYEHQGGTFNASKQKVFSRVETEDKSLSQKIADRLHPGYARDEQIIRREYVNIYY